MIYTLISRSNNTDIINSIDMIFQNTAEKQYTTFIIAVIGLYLGGREHAPPAVSPPPHPHVGVADGACTPVPPPVSGPIHAPRPPFMLFALNPWLCRRNVADALLAPPRQ